MEHLSCPTLAPAHPTCCAGHHGAVYALSRNPFFPKFFLSVGDWTTRVWNDDLRTPIVVSPYNACYLTGGGWSPTRPGVFYTITHAGTLEAWDYYFKQKEPVLSVRVADCPLTAWAPQAGATPRLAGVGSANGAVTILQLSEGLVEPQDNERAVISAVGVGVVTGTGFKAKQAALVAVPSALPCMDLTLPLTLAGQPAVNHPHLA